MDCSVESFADLLRHPQCGGCFIGGSEGIPRLFVRARNNVQWFFRLYGKTNDDAVRRVLKRAVQWLDDQGARA